MSKRKKTKRRHGRDTRPFKRSWSDKFLASSEWRALRAKVIERYGTKCMCCGYEPRDMSQVNVDHIKPRNRHPELALVEDNLQVLCASCNKEKGNKHETDYRPLAAMDRALKVRRLALMTSAHATAAMKPCDCGEGVMARWAGGAAMRCTACKLTKWMAQSETFAEAA